RIETCADPADDLAVDDDRKTALHLDEIPRRDRRNSTGIDSVLQRLTRFLEQCRGSSLAWCELYACNIGRVIHPQQQNQPTAIVDHGYDASQMIALSFRLGGRNNLLGGRRREYLLFGKLRSRTLCRKSERCGRNGKRNGSP